MKNIFNKILLLLCISFMNSLPIVNASAVVGTHSIVSKVIVENGNITIKGKSYCQSSEKFVVVALLLPNKTINDLTHTTDVTTVAEHFEIISANSDARYSYTFKTKGISQNYTLYVKSENDFETIILNPMVNKVFTFEKNIYVSPNGNDSNSGAVESPLLTFEGAKLKVREIYDSSVPVNVIFLGGTYNFEKSSKFTKDDSGTVDAPITYKAMTGEKVVFTGTKKLDVSAFSNVIDDNIIKRFPKNAQPHIKMMDLANQGITPQMVDMTKKISPCSSAIALGFYLNDKRQPISRYPNSGYNIIENSTIGKTSQNFTGTPDDGAIMGFSQNNPLNWTYAKDLYLEGFFASDWHQQWSKIESIDVNNKTMKFETYTEQGVKKGFRWAAVNLMEEIDIAGEWYVDTSTMILYYYPPYELTKNDTFELATLSDSFISMQNVQNVAFENLFFDKNADCTPYDVTGATVIHLNSLKGGNGIAMVDCNNITISNCCITNIARTAIVVEKSNNITIKQNVIDSVGAVGILSKICGNTATLEHCNNIISNNVISNTSRDTLGTNISCVVMSDVTGATIQNNIIHSIPTSAITYNGALLTIKNNELYNAIRKKADDGVIYAGANWTNCGNVIEYNYIHDYGDRELNAQVEVNGVFFDDTHCGNTVRYNIIGANSKEKTGGVKIGGGGENIVLGNTVYNSQSGIIGEDRTSTKPPEFLNTFKPYVNFLAFPYDSQLFLKKYPHLNEIKKGLDSTGNIFIPKNNKITDNLFVDTIKQSISPVIISNGTVKNNLRIDDYNVFVDKNNNDYRVSKSAKTQYGISNDVLDETFDLNSIGTVSNINMPYTNFKALSSIVSKNDVVLCWENAYNADEYEYIVATDSNFSNIVKRGVTRYNFVCVGELSDNKYYWKVIAKNTSLKLKSNVENENGVMEFSIPNTPIIVNSAVVNAKTLKLNLSNTSITNINYDIVLAVYDTTGKLKNFHTQKGAINQNATNEITNIEMPFNIEKGTTLKIIILDSLNNLKPLSRYKII